MSFPVNSKKVEIAKQEADSRNSFGNNGPTVKFFKLDGDSATIRVMPPWTDKEPYAGQFWRTVAQHWHVSSDVKAPILCQKKTPFIGGSCPICDFVDELLASDKPSHKEQALELRAKQSFLFTIVDVNDPEYTARDVKEWKKERGDREIPFQVGEPKLQVYAAPFTVYNMFITMSNTGNDILDLDHGHNITISKQGKNKNTKYTIIPELKPTKSNVPSDHPLIALEEVGILYPMDKIKEILESGVGSTFSLLKYETKILPSNGHKNVKNIQKTVEKDLEKFVDEGNDDEDDLSFVDND